MLLEHRGRAPRVADSAYVAPNAVVCGDVTVGEDARILFGAVVTAEDGAVAIGARSIVMEQAVVRGRARHRVRIASSTFPGTVLGVPRAPEGESLMPEAMRRYSDWLGAHRDDREVG